MQKHITDLEIRITHQEAAIDELTMTVLRQEKMMVKLQQEVTMLRKQLKGLSDIAPLSEETPPPHY